jgi:rod shape-determining protein MreB
LLKNLDVLLKTKTKLPIVIAEDPLSVVAVGAGKVLRNLSTLKELATA